MANNVEAGIRAHPSVIVDGKAAVRQPWWSVTAAAEKCRALGGVLVADQPDLGCGHRLLDVSIQLVRAGLQFQRALRPASAQCQNHFDASGSSTDDAEWAALLGVLPRQERQRRLQRFDGDTGSGWP